MFPKTVFGQAHGVVLIIDLANRASFDMIREWNNKISTEFRPNTQKVLIANKMDLEQQRAFSPMEAHKIARDLGFVGYYEISAKENINVNKPIEDLIQSIYF